MTGEAGPVRLRAAAAGDEDLLCRIYASTREEELALVDWTEEQKQTFLRQQFQAQDAYYRQHYPGAEFWVIERGGRRGEALGRLYLHHRPREIRLMDIALLPAARGQGVGEALLRGLQERAAREGKTLTIHVEKLNRARRLYERLGFLVVADRGVYDFLEWRPAGAAPG
ncbi:MAG: GNAT family N-acetyltransferase [Acidobacteriota bacterium]